MYLLKFFIINRSCPSSPHMYVYVCCYTLILTCTYMFVNTVFTPFTFFYVYIFKETPSTKHDKTIDIITLSSSLFLLFFPKIFFKRRIVNTNATVSHEIARMKFSTLNILLMRQSASLISSSLTRAKSVFFGKNSRRRPLAFSLLPLCQDE